MGSVLSRPRTYVRDLPRLVDLEKYEREKYAHKQRARAISSRDVLDIGVKQAK